MPDPRTTGVVHARQRLEYAQAALAEFRPGSSGSFGGGGGPVTVRISGPLFDGRAPAIIRRALDEAQQAVADQAYVNVMTFLHGSIQHPTPYYETQVINQRLGPDNVVHDRGIVYGPWLEGVGSRNRTTRFKGYHSFRRAAQQTQREAAGITAPILGRHLAELR